VTAAERIEALDARNPEAVELALAVALAVRVDPDLLRHARLMVGADAAAEADLWWSDLVAAQNPDGFILAPDVAEELRARLAQPQRRELRDAAWALVSSQHADAHLATRLEELVNWLSIAGGADAEDRIEDLLVASVDEWMASATEPAGGVRWILSALQRLPRAAAESPAATVIGAAAATHSAGEAPTLPAGAALPSDALDNWYPWLLARLPTTTIAVTLIDGGIEFEGSGQTVHALAVPQTDPVQLELTWHDGGPRRQQVRVIKGERTTVALHADEVEITTLAGQRSTIRRLGRPATSAGLDFAAVRAAHRPAGGLEEIVGEIAQRVREVNGWVAISGDPGTGKTTALCAVLDSLEAEGYLVLQHFYGRGPSWWDEDATVVRSLVEQLRAAVPGLPAVEETVQPDGSNGGLNKRELRDLLSASAERDGPRVVVAFDEPPVDSWDEMRAWTWRMGWPSLMPGRSSFIVAGRWAAGVRDFLEDGDPYKSVNVTMTVRDAVCRAYVQSLWDPLVAALGVPATPRVAFAGFASEELTARLQDFGFEPFGLDGAIEAAVERCDAGVVVLGDKPERDQIAFGRLCRERGRPLVVVLAGEHAGWDEVQAVAGGELSTADQIFARDLGRPDLPGGEERVAGELAQRLRVLVWSFVDELIALGEGSIERVRPIVDWVAAQPPGQASLETIPPSLTGAYPWAELGDVGWRLITAVAVAQPGFTFADLLWAAPLSEWPAFAAAVARLHETHQLHDPSGQLAALAAHPDVAPAVIVETYGALPLVSSDPHLAQSLPASVREESLPAAHRWLATAQDVLVGAATDYLARHAMAHAVASGDVEVVRGLCDVSALTRQARRFGLQAVAADLALARTVVDDGSLEAVRDAVVALAGRNGAEADFPRLLYHELAFRLGAQEASYHLHPNTAAQPYLEAWTRPFGDPARDARYVDIAALVELDTAVAAVSLGGEVFPLGGTESWHLGTRFDANAKLTGLPGQRIAVVADGTVRIASPGDDVLTPSPDLALVWASSAAGGLLAATRDGALVHWPHAGGEARLLLGHSGALTCVADGRAMWEVIARDALASIVVDGEPAGYGLFVAEGLVLADGTAAAAIASGTELAIRTGDAEYPARVEHREQPGVLTLLRADVAGHAVVPRAPAASDPTRLELDRHDVVGPTEVGGRTGLMLRRRTDAGDALERSGLSGFVFERGCLYAVIVSPSKEPMVAAEPVAPLAEQFGSRWALRRLVGTSAWFATGSEDGTVAVWTVDATTPLAVYRGHNAAVRTVSVVGRYVVSGGDDGTLRAWTPADGRDVAVLGAGAAITASAATADGCVWGAADGSLGVWHPQDGPVSERLPSHAGAVIGLSVEQDTLLSWAADGSVAVRSLSGTAPASVRHGPAPVGHAARSGPREIAVLWADDSVTIERVPTQDRAINSSCLAVSPDEAEIAIGFGDREGMIERDGEWAWHTHAAPPMHAAYARVGPSEARLFVLTSADAARSWGDGGRPTSIAFAGDVVAVGRTDGWIALSPPAEFAQAGGTVLVSSGAAPIASLAASDLGSLLVAGHEDGSVRLWDVASGGLVHTFTQAATATHVALAESHAAAADGATIHLWDVETAAEVGVLSEGRARVTGLAAVDPFADYERSMLVSCDEEGWLRLWDLGLRACVERFRAPRPLVAVAAGADTIAAREASGVTYAWSIRRSTSPVPAFDSLVGLRVQGGDERVEGRGSLTFPADVELRAIRWAADAGARGGRSTTRVAVDQPDGFWDELDDDGAFLTPPLVAAGRAIDVRIVGSSDLVADPADVEVLIELQAAHMPGPLTVRWR
jgi:WD40 repeat protein